MQRNVDVLVIGLGPAGASAARFAAQMGLQVLGVDRKSHLGEPVQCAEWVPAPLASHAQGAVVQRIRGMCSTLPSGFRQRSEVPGLMVDRAAFDRNLAQQAESSGAYLMTSTHLLTVDPVESIAIFKTEEGELSVSYRLLIAADGPSSPTAQALGLPPLSVVHTRQYTVPMLEPETETEVWLSDEYPGGYAWLFPKGAWANLGLGAERHAVEDLKQPLDALHRALIAQGRVGAEIAFRTGGAIPVGGLRERLVVGKVLFVGDAGGFTHPVTGAGIAAAVASGERAGQAAGDCLRGGHEQALMDFEEDMRDQFEASLRHAVERRKQLVCSRGEGEVAHRRGWIAFPEYFEESAS